MTSNRDPYIGIILREDPIAANAILPMAYRSRKNPHVPGYWTGFACPRCGMTFQQVDLESLGLSDFFHAIRYSCTALPRPCAPPPPLCASPAPVRLPRPCAPPTPDAAALLQAPARRPRSAPCPVSHQTDPDAAYTAYRAERALTTEWRAWRAAHGFCEPSWYHAWRCTVEAEVNARWGGFLRQTPRP